MHDDGKDNNVQSPVVRSMIILTNLIRPVSFSAAR